MRNEFAELQPVMLRRREEENKSEKKTVCTYISWRKGGGLIFIELPVRSEQIEIKILLFFEKTSQIYFYFESLRRRPWVFTFGALIWKLWLQELSFYFRHLLRVAWKIHCLRKEIESTLLLFFLFFFFCLWPWSHVSRRPFSKIFQKFAQTDFGTSGKKTEIESTHWKGSFIRPRGRRDGKCLLLALIMRKESGPSASAGGGGGGWSSAKQRVTTEILSASPLLSQRTHTHADISAHKTALIHHVS